MNLRKLKNQAGFTLVELIVVIAIMAILAGVAVPVYSGYIEKANKAADLQLLGAVNGAFAAACVENGVDAYTVEGNPRVNNLKNGPISVSVYDEAFQRYFAGNETAKFESISFLYFDKANGVFTDDLSKIALNEDFQKVLENLVGSENVPILMESIFGDMGSSVLMDKVSYTSDLAASLLGTSDGKFSEMILNCSAAMAGIMGLDPTSPEYAAVAKGMMIEKMEQLKNSDPKYANIDIDALYSKMSDPEAESPNELELELFNSANHAISANNAILAAAQKSGAASEKILTTLKGNPTSNLISEVDKGIAAGDTSESIAQVAMAYGLYTAYAERNNIQVPDDPSAVLSALSDSKFQAYLDTKEAEKDLAGYQASMNMVNEGVQGNTNAVADVLVNGFDDPQLVAVLQQALASTGSKTN